MKQISFVVSFFVTLIVTSLFASALRAQNFPAAGATPIYAIQGNGPATALQGEWRSSYGLVTGITGDGFYMQDATGDDDPQTSDGIFVYTRSAPQVQPGQCVHVERGYIDEFYEKTELSRIKAVTQADDCGAGQIEPVTITSARFRRDPAELFERYEGMLVALPDFAGVVHGPSKRFRDGEMEIALVADPLAPYVAGGRVFRRQPEIVPALIFLSNALGADLPDVSWHDRVAVRSNDDTDENPGVLVGVLDYNFGKYQLLPLPDQKIVGETAPVSAEQAGGPTASDFTICSFNLFGFGRGTEQIPQDAEYLPQLRKRARLIAENLSGCTIVGLQEVGSEADAQQLTRLLETEFGLDYTASVIHGPGALSSEYPLNTGYLTDDTRVEVQNIELRQACSSVDYGVNDASACPAGSYPLFNRPPSVIDLLVSGEWGDPYALRLINNHWKSKGGDESVNVRRRTRQAEHVASLVQESVTADPDAHVVVMGDLNDFPESVPIQTLRSALEPNLFSAADLLPTLDDYSYIYNGASQTLDYILVTLNMQPALAEVNAVRVNADFAYPEQVDPSSALHASDHDPLMVRIRPQGAAVLAADYGWPGITIQLHDDAGREAAAAITDLAGEARLWNLAPGAYTLTYNLPSYVVTNAESTPITLELSSGLNVVTPPEFQHRAVLSSSAIVQNLFAFDNLAGAPPAE